MTDPYALPKRVPTPLKWTVAVLVALVAALLLFEHRPHLGVILPTLILIGSALLYVVTRRRHGRTGHASHHQDDAMSE